MVLFIYFFFFTFYSSMTICNIDQITYWISDGSCDTDAGNNNAENSACITEINYIWKYIKLQNHYFKL